MEVVWSQSVTQLLLRGPLRHTRLSLPSVELVEIPSRTSILFYSIPYTNTLSRIQFTFTSLSAKFHNHSNSSIFNSNALFFTGKYLAGRRPPCWHETTRGSACNALRMRGPQVYSRGCIVHFSWLCRPYSTELDEGGVQLPALNVRKFALPLNVRTIKSAVHAAMVPSVTRYCSVVAALLVVLGILFESG